MGIRFIVTDREENGSDRVAMYDSVTGWAFGPVFASEDDAEAFLRHIAASGYSDARALNSGMLEALHGQFVRERASDVNLGRPTMGDHEDAERRAAAYGDTPKEGA